MGLDPKTISGADGRIRGYTVALPGDLNAGGTPVRYSGTKLAADLTWPKLVARWASTPPPAPIEQTDNGRTTPAERRETLEHAVEVAEGAIGAIHDDTGEDVDGITHSIGEVLAALARGSEGREHGPVTEITDRYDRAARTPNRVVPKRIGPIARDLRQASRQIAAVGALTGRGKEKFALFALLLALAGLIAEIAAWQQARGRVHQAAGKHSAGLPWVIFVVAWCDGPAGRAWCRSGGGPG